MSKKFIRADSSRFSKIGKRRKKLQVWRRSRGTHSKIRRKRRGYPVMPTVGYRTQRSKSGKVKGLNPVHVYTLNDLSKIGNGMIGIISARVGAKKRLDIIKMAQEKKIRLLNFGGAK